MKRAHRKGFALIELIIVIAIIAILPILCVYPFIQGELIKGMVVGGVKG